MSCSMVRVVAHQSAAWTSSYRNFVRLRLNTVGIYGGRSVHLTRNGKGRGNFSSARADVCWPRGCFALSHRHGAPRFRGNPDYVDAPP